MQAADTILEISRLKKSFGGVAAVNECTMTVGRGTVTGLIGPNGSGKTTLFNLLTGMLPADGGRVRFAGTNILGMKPHAIFRLGMSRTFQITRLFPKMTVLENLRVTTPRQGHSFDSRARAEELLQLFNLAELRDSYAEDLSYGQMKLLELARALVPDPMIVVLDEPFAGVNRVMAARIVELIRRFQAAGTTFFLIDHEMKIVMEICDWIYVMDFGVVIAEGRPEAVRENPQVVEAYFGR
jgi:ABC-type branched-subunit amino acid transport system ATPase component